MKKTLTVLFAVYILPTLLIPFPLVLFVAAFGGFDAKYENNEVENKLCAFLWATLVWLVLIGILARG